MNTETSKSAEPAKAVYQAIARGDAHQALNLSLEWRRAAPETSAPLIALSTARFLNQEWAKSRESIIAAMEFPIIERRDVIEAARLLRMHGLLQTSVELCEKALEVQPNDSHVLKMLADALRDSRHFDRAIDCYQEALALNPDDRDLHLVLAELDLYRGNLKAGFEAYEQRKAVPSQAGLFIDVPPENQIADASQIEGKRVGIVFEQGLGDIVLFGRFVPMLSERGARVTLFGIGRDQAFASLFKTAEAVRHKSADSVREALVAGELDYICDIGSLPRLFGVGANHVPADVPYLWPAARHAHELGHRYRQRAGGKPVVGISWTGGKVNLDQYRRTVPLKSWAPILSDRRFSFVSLQYGQENRDELAALGGALPGQLFDDESVDHVGDLHATVAQIQACDAILTVDNSTAHIAGALAKPVWTLLPSPCNWRWLVTGTRTPWYPTMRLVRQASFGEWGPVIESAHEDLIRLLGD